METLTAGRELDVEVASKVMGIPRTVDSGRWYIDGRHTTEPPPYSTSIAAAWQVVERLKADWNQKGDDEPLVWSFLDCGESGWRVEINWLHHDGDIQIESAVAESLPLAICDAALAWVQAYRH